MSETPCVTLKELTATDEREIAYIAGPMRGTPFYNFPAFDSVQSFLESLGYTAVSPATLDREQANFDAMKIDWPADYDWNRIPEGFDLAACVNRDLEAVKSCDILVLLDGWETSVGVQAEKAVAEWLKKRIVYQTAPSEVPPTLDNGCMRYFATGATRDTSQDKLDFDGFLSIEVLTEFAKYMHKHRKQSDGSLRASDNWRKGIPRECYRKSAWRHFLDWASLHRSGKDTIEAACALLFNIFGDTFEALKAQRSEAATDANVQSS